jgi:hypothetical protein
VSNVLDAIARARLNEIAKFFALEPAQIAQWLGHLGVDPLRVWGVANLMLRRGDDPVPPPRSWHKSEWDLWDTLPAGVQTYLAKREQERDRVVRLKQDEAAALKQKLTKLEHLERFLEVAAQPPKESTSAQEKEETDG